MIIKQIIRRGFEIVAILIVSTLIIGIIGNSNGDLSDPNWWRVVYSFILGYTICLFIRTPYKKYNIDYSIKKSEKRKKRLREGTVKTNVKSPSDTPKPKIKPAPQNSKNDFAGETRPYINPKFINKNKD